MEKRSNINYFKEEKQKIKEYKFMDDNLKIVNLLEKENLRCEICYKNILKKHETWDCKNCFKIVHLFCLEISQKKISNLSIYKWNCYTCGENYTDKIEPSYDCFCGKFTENSQFNNDFNEELIPHSCGCKCDFILEKNVRCNLPCHPGQHQFIENIEEFYNEIKKNHFSSHAEYENINPPKKKDINKQKTLDDFLIKNPITELTPKKKL